MSEKNPGEIRRDEIIAGIAADIVPDTATGYTALRAVVAEGITRYIAQQVTLETADERALEYVKQQEQNVRDRARAVADKLRRVAEDIDRAAERENVQKIPGEVVNLVVWGVANAKLDGVQNWLTDLNLLTQRMHEGKI